MQVQTVEAIKELDTTIEEEIETVFDSSLKPHHNAGVGKRILLLVYLTAMHRALQCNQLGCITQNHQLECCVLTLAREHLHYSLYMHAWILPSNYHEETVSIVKSGAGW